MWGVNWLVCLDERQNSGSQGDIAAANVCRKWAKKLERNLINSRSLTYIKIEDYYDILVILQRTFV